MAPPSGSLTGYFKTEFDFSLIFLTAYRDFLVKPLVKITTHFTKIFTIFAEVIIVKDVVVSVCQMPYIRALGKISDGHLNFYYVVDKQMRLNKVLSDFT